MITKPIIIIMTAMSGGTMTGFSFAWLLNIREEYTIFALTFCFLGIWYQFRNEKKNAVLTPAGVTYETNNPVVIDSTKQRINDEVSTIKNTITESISKTNATVKTDVVENIEVGFDELFSKVDGVAKRAYVALYQNEIEKSKTLIEETLNENCDNVYAHFLKFMIASNIFNEKSQNICKTSLKTFSNFKLAMQFADEEIAKILNGYEEKVLENITISNI